MRVASILVLVLSASTAFADVVPDAETLQVANTTRQLARLGRCSLALEQGKEVAERDAAYYREIVASDAALFRCHDEARLAGSYQEWRDRQPEHITHRIGIDGMASLGMAVMLGGWLRYEHASGFTARLAVIRGQVIESEDDGFDALVGHIGFRNYWGGFYLFAEAGGFALHHRTHLEPFGDDVMHEGYWRALPSLAAGLGGKIGRADIGLSFLVPAMSLGVSLGFDFARL